MFGTLGGPEVILILVVALIVFGPRRLPEIGKSMGKMLAEFRKASTDFQRTIHDEIEADKEREAQAAQAPPAAVALPAAPVEAPVQVAEADVTAVAVEPRIAQPDAPIVSRGSAPSEPD